MSDDSMRAKARATFGKEFMNIMKPQAPAKNEAVALQKRANARPIPTYKVGGPVKKQNGGALTPAEKARAEEIIKQRGDAAMRDPLVMRLIEEQNRRPMGVPGVGPKAAERRAEGGGIEDERVAARMAAGNYKKGGKAKKDELAVMIAIGKPMKGMKKPVKRAVGGAGKTRKGMC